MGLKFLDEVAREANSEACYAFLDGELAQECVGMMHTVSVFSWQVKCVASISLIQHCAAPPGRLEHLAPPHLGSPLASSMQDEGQHTSPPRLGTLPLHISTRSPSGNQLPSPSPVFSCCIVPLGTFVP